MANDNLNIQLQEINKLPKTENEAGLFIVASQETSGNNKAVTYPLKNKADVSYVEKLEKKVKKIEDATTNSKGYYSTEAQLLAAYPSPSVGYTAWVGVPYPGVVYKCETKGIWTATAEIPDVEDVDLNEYAKNGGSEKTVQDLDEEKGNKTNINGDEIVYIENGDLTNVYGIVLEGNSQNSIPGGNIFDNSDIVSGKYLNGKTSGAETTANGVSFNRTYVSVKANTTYLSDLNIELETCIVFYDSSKAFIGYVGKGVNSPLGSFLTPANCAYIRYNFLNTEGTSGYYIKEDVKVSTGRYRVSLELDDITGATPINAESPNIFDNSDIVSGKYLDNTNTEKVGATLAYNRAYVEVEPNITYQSDLIDFSYTVLFYKSDKAFISSIGNNTGKAIGQFTTPTECKYIRYNLNKDQTDGFTVKKEGLSANGIKFTNLFIDKKNIIGEESDGSDIKLSDLKDAIVTDSKNIFDNSDIVSGKYLNGKSSGAETTASGVSFNRAYVSVKANTTYLTDLNIELETCIVFYDSSKTFISYVGKAVNSPLGSFLTPANCAYIRYNFLNTEGTSGYVIESGSSSVMFSDLYINESNIIKNGVDPTDPYSINMRNTNTFVGSMNKIVDALLTKKSRAKFVFITHFTEDWQGKQTSKALIDVQIKLAKYWCADILVLSDKLHLVNRDGINNLHAIIPDDLHPGVDSSGETVARITKFCTAFLYPIFSNEWTGKKIAWYGTSIPYGHPNPSLFAYPPKVATALGATCQNYAVSGSVVRLSTTSGSGISGRHSFLDTNQSINYISKMVDLIGTANEPDVFVFDYGINDFGLDKTDFNIL